MSLNYDLRIKIVSENSVIFPYDEIAEAFSGIGFVNGIPRSDGKVADFEIVSSYLGRFYRSLPLLIYEKELKQSSKIIGKKLYVGTKIFDISEYLGMNIKLKKPKSFKKYSMIDILNGKNKRVLKIKFLIVFYDGL